MSTSGADLDVYRDWLGIPDAERPPDHYALLRLVRFEDDEEKIRSNYRKLNAHVRTYASGRYGPRSQELLNELAKAMLCLTDPDRKREYDESLGRTFEETEAPGPQPMGQWLVRKKVLSRDQFREAESFAEARGLSLRDAVVQMKLVKPPVAARALAQELGLSYVDLAETTPDDSVLDKLPRATVKHHSILPLFVDDDVLLVACVDEPPHELDDELRLRYGVPARWAITTPLAMQQAIAKHYAPGARDTAEAVVISGKGGGRKGGKTEPSRVPYAKLPEAERRQRLQTGGLAIGWAAMLPLLLPLLLDLIGLRITVSMEVQALAALLLGGGAAAATAVMNYFSPRIAGVAFGAVCVVTALAYVAGKLFGGG